jgi:hypothetical protein
MKTIAFVSAVYLSLATSLTGAAGNSEMASALAACREEAVSTGLVEQADITAYVDLCMQAWQPADGYTDSYAPAEEVLESPSEVNQYDDPGTPVGEERVPEAPTEDMQYDDPETPEGEERVPALDDGGIY